MAIDFILKPKQKIVFSLGWGTMSFADVLDQRTRLAEDSRFGLDFRQIMDVTRVTDFELSGDQIRTLAQRLVFAPESRRALVTASSLHHGLGRMFHAYSEAQNINLFKDLNEAAEWVGMPMEVVNKAFLALCLANDLA